MASLIMIVEIIVTQGHTKDPLRQQGAPRVFHAIGMTVVNEAFRQTVEHSNA